MLGITFPNMEKFEAEFESIEAGFYAAYQISTVLKRYTVRGGVFSHNDQALLRSALALIENGAVKIEGANANAFDPIGKDRAANAVVIAAEMLITALIHMGIGENDSAFMCITQASCEVYAYVMNWMAETVGGNTEVMDEAQLIFKAFNS